MEASFSTWAGLWHYLSPLLLVDSFGSIFAIPFAFETVLHTFQLSNQYLNFWCLKWSSSDTLIYWLHYLWCYWCSAIAFILIILPNCFPPNLVNKRSLALISAIYELWTACSRWPINCTTQYQSQGSPCRHYSRNPHCCVAPLDAICSMMSATFHYSLLHTLHEDSQNYFYSDSAHNISPVFPTMSYLSSLFFE